MKKLLLPFMLIFVLLISACSSGSTESKNDSSKNSESKTITYQSEDGPVKVPANPKRVVVLGSYAGNVLSLGVNVELSTSSLFITTVLSGCQSGLVSLSRSLLTATLPISS